MIEWGYEKYVRDHSILVGFTDEFAKQYPDRVEKYPGADGESLPGGVLPTPSDRAPESRYDRPSQRYPRTHTYLGREDDRNVTSDINHRSSSEILAQGI